MAQYYTPFLAQAGQAIGRGLEAKGIKQQKEQQNKLAGSAYMGDPQAMEELMQVNPSLGVQVQQATQKRKETGQQQELEKRTQFKTEYDDIMGNIAKFGSFEEAKGYADSRISDVAQRYPEIMSKLGEDAIFDEKDFQLAKKLSGEPVKASEREIKIKGLTERGIAQDTASDIVEGRVKVTSPDQFGNIYAVNLTDNSKKLIVSGSKPAHAEPQKDFQAEPSTADIEASVEEGTGPGASLRAFANSVIGPFMEGQPYPETSKAKAAIGLFNQEAKTALVNNPRFPVAEQKIIQGLLPDTDKIITDPDGEREKVRQLRSFLTSKKSQNNQAISSGSITEKEVGRLSNQNASIDRTIGLMGEGSDMPIPQTIEEFNTLEPGTIYISPDDGKKYRKPS